MTGSCHLSGILLHKIPIAAGNAQSVILEHWAISTTTLHSQATTSFSIFRCHASYQLFSCFGRLDIAFGV
jgi:hypothetical protein